MSHHKFPRSGRLHKGYSCRQVEAFINHLEVSLSGVFPMPSAADEQIPWLLSATGRAPLQDGLITKDSKANGKS